jgi:MinD superfamily P-loop ATPase
VGLLSNCARACRLNAELWLRQRRPETMRSKGEGKAMCARHPRPPERIGAGVSAQGALDGSNVLLSYGFVAAAMEALVTRLAAEL